MSATYLDSIVAWHVERARADSRALAQLIDAAMQCAPPRGFVRSIQETPHLAVIAEVKRRSPSKGLLVENLDAALLAEQYQRGGASCLSVLTDENHFEGSAQDLQQARQACSLPVLRKDFTVDARDVCDARLIGADCVLLIVAALSSSQIRDYIQLATQIDLDVLVEVHDEQELEIAIDAGATMVGVNQRNLVTFNVDHDRAVRMGGVIPSHMVKVAESGIRGRADAESLRNAGYDAVLVGEHLVTSVDPALALTDLCVS